MHTKQKSVRHRDLLGILLICALTVISAGCGRKMFPKPSGEEAAPQVKDLQAQVMPHAVELSWSLPAKVPGHDMHYSVMRAELKWENRDCAECPGTPQQEIQVLDPSSAAAMVSSDQKFRWTDPNAAFHRAYRYQVVLQDNRGNAVSTSNPVIARMFPGPAAPINVAAATQSQGILLNWKPATRDLEGHDLQGDIGFRVERLAQNKGWEKVSPNSIKGNSFLDQGIASQQNYSYRIVPVSIIENTPVLGEPSAVVLAKAPESVTPPPPGNVWIVPAKGALEIHWTESEGNNAGYHVYRREGKEIIRLTASPIQHPPFMDKGAKRNATYFYAVSAVSAQSDHKEGLLSKWAEMRNLLME